MFVFVRRHLPWSLKLTSPYSSDRVVMAASSSIIRAPYSDRSVVADVVVVGAGLSGLRAATDIQKAGLSCVVLEANNRVGGKTYSAPAFEGSAGKVELGGAWVNDTTQSYMYAMAKDFGLDLEVQRVEGITIYESKDRALSKFVGQESPVRKAGGRSSRPIMTDQR